MRSRKRSDSQTTTGSVVEASREKEEKEGKKKGGRCGDATIQRRTASLLHKQLNQLGPSKSHRYDMRLGQQLDGFDRPWHALAGTCFPMCKGADLTTCNHPPRIFTGCSNLVMDLQADAVLRVFQDGL